MKVKQKRTFTVDEDVDNIIRKYLVLMVNKTDENYSYSRCVNDLIRGGKK